MKEIKSFENLYDLEMKEYRAACSLDLLFIRDYKIIADGYCLIMGADCKTHLDLYLITFKTYKSFNEGEKSYLKHHYGISNN